MAIKRLGTLLVEEQLINEEQLQKALTQQRTSGAPLGETLVQLGFINEEALYRFLAIQQGLDFNSLEGVELPEELLNMVPVAVAWRYQAVPVSRDNGTVIVATSQPDDLSRFYLPQELKLDGNMKVKIVVAPASQISELLNKHFRKATEKSAGEIQTAGRAAGAIQPEAAPDTNQINLLESVEQDLLSTEATADLEILAEEKDEEGEEHEDQAPVIKMCNYILADAVRQRASDIHITPYEKKMVLKYRIDGTLVEFPAPPIKAKRRVCARFKVMANLNIIEKRKPQDGRINFMVSGKQIGLRISTLPTRWGENIVMRVIDQSNAALEIEKLGFEPDQLAHFKKAIAQPYGMVFITGPTGSGKTTTLFAALSHVNTPAKNIVTLEDPVEFRLPNIIQIQVDDVAGRSFATVLRAFLRHDPNIMLIGEIRDSETATIAVQASLTGHLVLSSLHTNDAPSTIMRLVDLGVEPIYVGSSILCVVSQRLVRRICEKCKVEVKIPDEELRGVGLSPEEIETTKFYKGAGCSACHKSGYKGRVAVHEVLPVTPEIQKIIFDKGTLDDLKQAAREAGIMNLRESALLKWKRGLTTLEEVLAETFV